MFYDLIYLMDVYIKTIKCLFHLISLYFQNSVSNCKEQFKRGVFMGKKFILSAALLFSLAVCLNGCSSLPTGTQVNVSNSSYDYVENFDGGLKMNLTKKILDENLMKIEFSFDCTNGNIKVNEDALQSSDFNCYLINKTDKTKISNSGDIPLSDNMLYFDNVDLEEYNLHFEYPLIIELDSPYSVDIDINSSQDDTAHKISLPLDNYIEIVDISAPREYDKYTEKCVDISFLTSENLTFDIQTDKSSIATGAAIGDLVKTDNNRYTYSHPITNTEENITLSFTNIKITNTLNCDIDF